MHKDAFFSLLSTEVFSKELGLYSFLKDWEELATPSELPSALLCLHREPAFLVPLLTSAVPLNCHFLMTFWIVEISR